jgi:hypothetical protein
MTDPVPSKERIGFLAEYWAAKLKSHQRWPEGQGLHAEVLGRIYADTITALRQMHSASEPPVTPPSAIPFAGVSKGVNYEALANATHPDLMYGGDSPASLEHLQRRAADSPGGAIVEILADDVRALLRAAQPPRDGQIPCKECGAIAWVSDEPEDHIHCSKCGYEPAGDEQ